MSDEIKEILYLEKYIDKYKSDEKSIINGNRLTTPAMLDYLEVKVLLDYITNLQKDRDDLDDYNRHLHTELTNLQEEIEELKKINESHQKLNGELREEISKLENKIHALEKHNQKLQLEAQKYFDLLMECEHGGDKE